MAELDWLEDGDGNDLGADDVAQEPTEPAGPTQEEIETWRQSHSAIQNLQANPAAMRDFVLRQAQAMGLQLNDARQPQPLNPPQEYVELVKNSLSPEMQFLAPQIAKATYAATEASLAPVRQQQQRVAEEAKAGAYENMAKELSAENPGWEKYEDEMLGILGFLRDALTGQGSMVHNRYGSALKLLYRLASGEGAAVAQAGRRMGEAARNATRTSAGSNRGGGPDLQTMISKAATSQDKWRVAMRHALQEHGVS